MIQINPPKYVRQILFTLQSRSHLAYLVGGCVRDVIMGMTPQDWDICTSALPDEVLELFPGSRPTGLQHGTVTVIIGSKSAEVTTFRTEGDYRDHRRPDSVTFVSDLITDLSRRDFTMNAIALSADGMLADPFDGVHDIESRCIRCVGNPKVRFSEDALRMFRALRFSARLGFTIEYDTLNAIEECAKEASSLSPERVRDEVEKILLTPRPETMSAAISFGLMNNYISGTGWKMPNFADMANMPRKPLARWAAFSIMLRKYGYIPSVGEFLTKLRLDGRTIRCCKDADVILSGDLPKDSLAWKKLLNRYGVDTVTCAVQACSVISGEDFEKDLRAILKSGECFSLKHLAVSGDDLLSLGLKGPELGEMLNFLLDYVMEYPDNNKREILLNLAKYSEES
jgi:tRNA nucleotidyltransferase (CCA-adding enzyme)